MSGSTSFEQLCAGGSGYACDEHSMAKLNKEESYNDLIFKLVTKCETNLLFLPSPTCSVSQFTIDVIPNYSKSALPSAWQSCEQKGYDGLHVIALLDLSNTPRNGSITKYSFAQFVDGVIRGMEYYFMFQRYNSHFALNALNLWSSPTERDLQSCYIAIAWKFESQSLPKKDLFSRSLLNQLNVSSVDLKRKAEISESNLSIDERRKSLPAKRGSKPAASSSRGRRSLAPKSNERYTDDSTDEDDPEISFKVKPKEIIPKVTYIPLQISPKEELSQTSDVMETEPISMEDITFGFEKGQPKKGGRKSTARKSLMPDWPENEKNDVLFFFDNLNPSQTEQTCIALTCKYASMQFDRELPSKLLYQWVQKKGRPLKKALNNYEIPKEEQREVTLDLFKKLNKNISETSRVAFTCKYLHAQYGVNLTSKEFYNWLNDKGKKTPKRR